MLASLGTCSIAAYGRLSREAAGFRGSIPYSCQQANYINALAVSISPIFEPAKGTLGGSFFSPWVDFFMTLGELFKPGRC
jgi:hypothetical protein